MKLGFFLILFLLSIYPVTAIPELPLIVNGDVEINNKDAPIGTVITAEMDNKIAATFKVEKEGEYAFVLNKNDAKNNTVTFYVDGIKAEESIEWQSGKVAKVDLSVRKKGDKLTGFAVGNITTSNAAAIPLLVIAVIIALLIIFIAVKRVKK